MYKKTVMLLAAFILFGASYSNASLFDDDSSYITSTSEGDINWSTMTVRAKGNSKELFADPSDKAADMTGEEAAISDARFNLYETIKEVPISSSYQIDDEVYIYPDVREKVKALVFKAPVVGKPVKTEDGSFEAVVELKITGGILDTIFPKVKTLPAGGDVGFQGRGMYTSVIFDASMTNMTPTLTLQIIDDNDKPYYNLDKLNRPVAVKSGLIKFFPTMEAAKKSRYAGKKPFIVNKTRLDKYKEDTIIVLNPILDKIRNDAFVSEILGKCKVIFIIK